MEVVFQYAIHQALSCDQVRSYYIASSHTRLIRCLTLRFHLLYARIDGLGNPNQIILPHEASIVCDTSTHLIRDH